MNKDLQLDGLYDFVDSMLNLEKFDVIDLLFTQNPEILPKHIIIGYLSTTLAAKSKLPNRTQFYTKAVELLGEKLLEGLE